MSFNEKKIKISQFGEKGITVRPPSLVFWHQREGNESNKKIYPEVSEVEKTTSRGERRLLRAERPLRRTGRRFEARFREMARNSRKIKNFPKWHRTVFRRLFEVRRRRRRREGEARRARQGRRQWKPRVRPLHRGERQGQGFGRPPTPRFDLLLLLLFLESRFRQGRLPLPKMPALPRRRSPALSLLRRVLVWPQIRPLWALPKRILRRREHRVQIREVLHLRVRVFRAGIHQ